MAVACAVSKVHAAREGSSTPKKVSASLIDWSTRRRSSAIAGYLAGYSGATLDAYGLDLRQWVTWLDVCGVAVLALSEPSTDWAPTTGSATLPSGPTTLVDDLGNSGADGVKEPRLRVATTDGGRRLGAR
jgi:hypothetical protein